MIEGLDHCEIPVRDLARAVAWYKEMLGLQLVMPVNPGSGEAFLRVPNKEPLVLMLHEAKDLKPACFVQEGAPKAPIWFSTTNMHELYRRLEKGGTKIAETDPIPEQYEDPKREFLFLQFFDPDGNVLGVIQNNL